MTTTEQPNEKGGLGERLANFANWVNENVVGSPYTFLFCICFVVFIYLLIAPLGYSKWNTGPGLFSNTAESSFELITGVGAVVGVYAVRRAQHRHNAQLVAHNESIDDLHAKVDALTEMQQTDFEDLERDVLQLASLRPGPEAAKLSASICMRLKGTQPDATPEVVAP